LAYHLAFTPAARRQFRKLTAEVQRRLAPAIDALAEAPRPPGAKRLAGTPDLWRIRVGYYRILYALDDGRLTVLVVRLGHRREVYEGQS
jgi:mRNA interferase RelE/StbE